MKNRHLLLLFLILTVSVTSYGDDEVIEDDAVTEEAQAEASEHAVSEQENAEELGKALSDEAPATPEPTDTGTEYKSVHKVDLKDEEAPAEKPKQAMSKEERQKFFDKTDSDCFTFDHPEKYPNSVVMMKNCTKAFKKIRNRGGLKWAMIYFDRNQEQIEDAKCMKRASAQRAVARKGIQNKCQILFMDSSDLCKNGKFKRKRVIQAQFIDLCAEKGLALYPVKVKAGSLTCKYHFSDENKDSTAVGAYLSRTKKASGELIAYGLNESNYMAERLPVLSEKKIMAKLVKEQTLIVNAGPHKYHQDPSLCMNGRPETPRVNKAGKSVELRAPASKSKAKSSAKSKKRKK